MGFLDKLSDTVYKAADVTGKKAKEVGEIAKLKFENSRLKDEMEKAYIEIGKKHFAEIKDTCPEEYAELIIKINSAAAEIEANKQRLAEMKEDDE